MVRTLKISSLSLDTDKDRVLVCVRLNRSGIEDFVRLPFFNTFVRSVLGGFFLIIVLLLFIYYFIFTAYFASLKHVKINHRLDKSDVINDPLL